MAVRTPMMVLLMAMFVGSKILPPHGVRPVPACNCPELTCNCPEESIVDVTCNCNCGTPQNPCPSLDPPQSPSLSPSGECIDTNYNLCFNPLSNALHFTSTGMTIGQEVANTLAYVSSVELTSVTQTWDGVCRTFIELSSTLYVEFFTITYVNGNYETLVYLLADQPNSPGSVVATQNTQSADSAVGYRTSIASTTISGYTLYGFYVFYGYGSCSKINYYPRFYDTTSVYPTQIPLSVRTQAASQLLVNASSVVQLPYNNLAYCITEVSGIQVINSQNIGPAIGISWPPSCSTYTA